MSECAGVTCDHSSHSLTQEKIDGMGKTLSEQFPAKGEPIGSPTGILPPEAVLETKTPAKAERQEKQCAWCGHPMMVAAGQEANYHGGECRMFARRMARREARKEARKEVAV